MAGTKRKQTSSKNSGGTSKKAKQTAKKAAPKDIKIPIDEGFNGPAKAKVYIGEEDDVIYDASLNQTNIGNNANKFYRLQMLKETKNKFYTHTRWGRVGEFGQVKTMGPLDIDEATKEFKKKFKEKSGLPWEDRNSDPKSGKYTFIEKSYEEDEEEADGGDTKVKTEDDDEEKEDPTSKLPIQTQRLIELIFNENHFNSVLENIGYNQDKLPLGKLGKGTLTKGFAHLKELSSLIKHPSLAQNKYKQTQQQAIEEYTNKYYSTIPHVFGRDRPPLINNWDILQKEVAMLDTLSDMEIASQIMKTTNEKSRDASSVSLIDQRFHQLSLDEITPLESKSKEYQLLKEYLINTAGHTHNIRYRLQDIFRISMKGENDRYMKSEYAKRKNSCRRLLWHGSRTTNYGGILSQGLRIAPPEAPPSGYAFGKGIYLADISTKSANYCLAGMSGQHGLLLLCEAELGNPMYEIHTSDTQADEAAKKNKCISTKGIGQTAPQGWMDAGAVHDSLKGVLMPDPSKKTGQGDNNAFLLYNEYICYNVAQVRLRYLIRFAL